MPSVPPIYTRVTLKDIAREVGVSVNAASKVLNNTRSSGQVSEETRRRIIAAAKEMGYQPNYAARSLVRRRSDIVAMFFDVEFLDTAEPYIAAIIAGAERGCRERNQSLLLYTRGNDASVDQTSAKLLSGAADAVALPSWTTPDVIDRIAAAGIPAICYPSVREPLPSIVIDEKSAAELAIDHLASRGHTRILYHHSTWIETRRPDLYREIAAARGLPVEMMRAADDYGHLSPQEQEILLRARDDRPTAVACWNDEFAYRVLEFCDQNGLKVPEDLAVIGFDGAATFPTPRRRLTTVFVPWADLARNAVNLLVDIRDGKPVTKQTLLPVSLREGDTV